MRCVGSILLDENQKLQNVSIFRPLNEHPAPVDDRCVAEGKYAVCHDNTHHGDVLQDPVDALTPSRRSVPTPIVSERAASCQ